MGKENLKRLFSSIILVMLCVGTLAVAFRVQPVKAATLIVPDNYATIQGAIDAASMGDTILVRPGIYPESLNVNMSNLMIVSQYREAATVQGFDLNNVSCVSIVNFTINGGGITFDNSSFNTIRDNNITNCMYGLYFNYMNYSQQPPQEPELCDNNTVFENDISNCTDAIFFMEGLTYNRFYHNNFYSTKVDYAVPSVEFWDNGYPSGGNYWSGCTMVDTKWGPNQDQPGHDGINDTQYMVYTLNYGAMPGYDRYPLTVPWSPPDIAVTSVTPSKNVVGQGYALSINTTLQNSGNKVEEFNVSVHGNATAIYTFPDIIFLVGTGSGVCTWNTTGVPEGNYTLWSNATILEGEVNTANNNCTGGVVKVSIPGDINGDFRVNLSDLVLLAKAYNTGPGMPKWNPNADINGDGWVGLSDLTIMARHYNQSVP